MKTLTGKTAKLMALLVILWMLAFQISILFWRVYPAPDLHSAQAMNTLVSSKNNKTQRPNSQQQAVAIGSAYLFGKPEIVAENTPAVQTEIAPETRLNYKLRGIYYSAQPELSSAIVEVKANETNYYIIDDELAENITVGAIEVDHILINRYGKLERLNLEKSANLGRSPVANNRANAPDQQMSSTLLKNYKQRYVSNPLALARRFQAIPVQKNGKNVGFKLKALRGESLLKKLNFQDSDVFVKVNGIGLDEPFQALDALKSLTTASSVSVTILRNGAEQTLDFSL